MIILHFALKSEWDAVSKKKKYGSTCIKTNKYIPCYKVSDIPSANINFSTLKDYVILCIDDKKVNSEIKYEQLENTTLEEPNIYGEISKDSVICVLPYTFDDEDKFVITKELLDFICINEVLENLKIEYKNHKYFHDGTSSRIILLNDEFIIKQADSNMLKAEVTFANFYNNIPELQKVIYYNKNYDFVVYKFVPGDVMHIVVDFKNLASSIYKIVSEYLPYKEEGFGYLTNPTSSWEEFLRNEVKEASLILPDVNNLLESVYEAINTLSNFPFEKKLLHGDFGTHNFIKENEKFVAAIDPIPLIGDPAYDLLYALVSNIDLIPFLSINYLTDYLKAPKDKVVALLKVVLFCRICKTAKYNKNDLEAYIDFWYNIFK